MTQEPEKKPKRSRASAARFDKVEVMQSLISESYGKVKTRARSYVYKNEQHAQVTFSYDVKKFMERHDLTIKEFAAIIGRSYWSVNSWVNMQKFTNDIISVVETMRVLDAATGKHP